MDIRADSLAFHIGDYLTTKLDYQPDVIITNPPFNLAQPIIQKSLLEVRDGGLVIMLLRLNFFGGQERKLWIQTNMPAFAYVHAKRIGFVPDDVRDAKKAEAKAAGLDPNKVKGISTDSIEYAHFIWQRGNRPKFTKTCVI